MKKILITQRFQKEVMALGSERRPAVFEAILSIEKALGYPHLHAGLGMRKLHAVGIWEVRLGLGLRMVFTVGDDAITLVMVGTHDEVRRYLRTL